jgi:tRNA G10  N-methylase Trm11
MLPAIAAHAITHLTRPGDLVLDPMCGAGTSLVEAVHQGRRAVGVDVEPRWAELARRNVRLARELGARGTGHVVCADARDLSANLPHPVAAEVRGQLRLVLTSPPYGPSTHGQVEVRPGGGVSKSDYRYGPSTRTENLAHQSLPTLCAGLESILAGCRDLLTADAYVVITVRPWRRRGELIDLPAAVTTAAERAGLALTQRCVALLAGLREGRLVTRASFFQRDAVAKARAAGIPRQLICHEDALIFQPA